MIANNSIPVTLFLTDLEWEDELGSTRYPVNRVRFDDDDDDELNPWLDETGDIDFDLEFDTSTPYVSVTVAGCQFVPITALSDSTRTQTGAVMNGDRLQDPTASDVLTTVSGPLLWEYSGRQLAMLVQAAEWYGTRAYDVAAYIAHTFYPELGVLDSRGHAIVTVDALPPNTAGISPHDVHELGGSPLSVTPADAVHHRPPTTGPTQSLRYLFHYDITETDNWGVRVDISNDFLEYADVIIDSLPRNLPTSFRRQFEPLLSQRIDYTLDDHRSDRRCGGEPSNWHHSSGFAEGVSSAINIAHTAISQAVFAYAKGEDWVLTIQPYRRQM